MVYLRDVPLVEPGPIEERWETVEELEGIVTRSRVRRGRGRTRLLSRTDNIALFRFERLEVVRIGNSNRLEEAAWRYGRDVRQRWLAASSVSGGHAVTLGAVIVGGVLTRTLPWRYTFRNPTRCAVGSGSATALGRVANNVGSVGFRSGDSRSSTGRS